MLTINYIILFDSIVRTYKKNVQRLYPRKIEVILNKFKYLEKWGLHLTSG